MENQISVNPNYDPNAPVNSNSLYGGFGILGMVLIAIILMARSV